MLYIVATPIGNLEDITIRALNTLKSSDYILCEDTRKSSILLNHYKIKKRLISFHKFNEKKREKKILEDLESGKNISLISDSGTPIISDPGLLLVKTCIEKNIKITSIPGPCSIITAITLSGIKNTPFQFLGFFPKKGRDKEILKILSYRGLSIYFESAKRLLKILKIFQKKAPDLELTIARELTKKFEEIKKGKADQLIDHFTQKNPKGEIVFLIDNFLKK
jgi:16S rRNA (cytidine1402-2'-O)-methyltransferase